MSNPIRDIQNPLRDLLNPLWDIQNPLRDLLNPLRDTQNPLRDLLNPLRDIQNPLRDLLNPLRDIQNPLRDLLNPLRGEDIRIREKSKINLPKTVNYVLSPQNLPAQFTARQILLRHQYRRLGYRHGGVCPVADMGVQPVVV